MRTALVQPPVFWTTTPPLGIAYLAGELRAAGDPVAMFDFNIELFADPAAYSAVRELASAFDHGSPLRRLPPDEAFGRLATGWPDEWRCLSRAADQWADRVLATAPEVMGISVHEESLLAALVLAARVRDAAGRTAPPRIIAGGPDAIFLQRHPAALHAGIIDAVVVGEGEGALRELRRRIVAAEIDFRADGLGETECAGVLLRSRSGALLDATAGAALVEIDGIEPPSFDGLPLGSYSFARTLPILGSRGCPAKCTFCFETVMWARFRRRSVGAVVDEMCQRLAQYGEPLSFRFNDSLLNGDIAWLAELSAEIRARRLPIKWHGNARIHPAMRRPFLEQLAEAGLTGLLYGVESGSDRILRRMKKGVRAADVPRVLRDTHASGIWTHGFFILGFPGETDEEALQTLDLLIDASANLDSLVFHDFALPPELAEYVNFAGRVAMNDDASIEPEARPHLVAVRPWMQAYLAHFLTFAHAHGDLHWNELNATQARACLDLYRSRWHTSAAYARARAALVIARTLLAELHRRQSRSVAQADDRPDDRALEWALNAGADDRERVIDAVAPAWQSTAPSHEDVLAALAHHVNRCAAAGADAPIRHEAFAPEAFR